MTSRVIPHAGKNIGYIKLTSFTHDTAAAFKQAARAQLVQGVHGFVIDLRNNPGGYLEQSVEVSSAFIPSGTIVSTIRRGDQKDEVKALGNAFLQDQKIVVLVNQGSASAAEIVAGALQDTGHAQVVGQQTFGKGSVQEYQPFSDGSSLKLTVAKWYTPSGRSIADEGIKPNIEVTMSPEDSDQDKDPQLDRALALLVPSS